jgi:hypothetical protein
MDYTSFQDFERVSGAIEAFRLSTPCYIYTALLGHHGVNMHGSKSRNKSLIVHIKKICEGKETT